MKTWFNNHMFCGYIILLQVVLTLDGVRFVIKFVTVTQLNPHRVYVKVVIVQTQNVLKTTWECLVMQVKIYILLGARNSIKQS